MRMDTSSSKRTSIPGSNAVAFFPKCGEHRLHSSGIDSGRAVIVVT
jgi:hypothetical protein